MDTTDIPKPAVETVSPPEGGRDLVDIWGGDVGFHYTIDRGLPGILEHGLLSRMEEQKRGLKLRIGISRSIPDTVYFTTEPQDLYVRERTVDDEGKSLEEKMSELVGIVIGRPSYAYKSAGHFGVQDAVEPSDMKGLVFMDQEVSRTPYNEEKGSHDSYRFGKHLSWEACQERVKVLREMCEKVGIKDMPIYGISGNMYSPKGLTRASVRAEIHSARK